MTDTAQAHDETTEPELTYEQRAERLAALARERDKEG